MTRYTISKELDAWKVTYGDAVAYRSTKEEAMGWIEAHYRREQMDRIERSLARSEKRLALIACAATAIFLVVVSAAIL